MIVESCAKTWPVCHRSFVDWLAGLDDSLDISHIPALSVFRPRPRRGNTTTVSTRVTTGIRETRRRAPPPVGPWPWPPPPVDRRYLRPPGECRVGVLEVERIAKKRPAERARASRPVVATVASGRDRRHPRARPHPVRRGTDRGQVIDSERKRPAAKPVLIVRNGARTAVAGRDRRPDREITNL